MGHYFLDTQYDYPQKKCGSGCYTECPINLVNFFDGDFLYKNWLPRQFAVKKMTYLVPQPYLKQQLCEAAGAKGTIQDISYKHCIKGRLGYKNKIRGCKICTCNF